MMVTHYDYDVLQREIERLQNKYSCLEINCIGKTEQKREIYCITLGKGKKKIHINASHHANEWITSAVLMDSVEFFAKIKEGNDFCKPVGLDLEVLENTTYDFVPMVNPDGVEICIHGLKNQLSKNFLYKANEYSDDFSRWRANANGVDLNRNYDVGFEKCVMLSGLNAPCYGYYQGRAAVSENETKAMVKLTIKRNYDLVLAYHTQGEEIYWRYNNNVIEKAESYAKAFSRVSQYKLGEPEPGAIAGGYKDWFIDTFKKPGFTIECGLGVNPIEITQRSNILERTLPILWLAGKEEID